MRAGPTFLHGMHLLSRRLLLASFLLAAGATRAQAPASPDGLQLLAEFLKSVQTGRAQFTQAVTPPAREGQAQRPRLSSGSFEFARPNRFRFVYAKPFAQVLVADGQTLWLHDVDLNQVTARKLAQVLQGTPAAVIATASDLRSLQADFQLSAEPPAGGLQWVQALPRGQGGQLQSIRVGLRGGPRGVELVSLDILDSFGQRSVMSFSDFQPNVPLPAGSFQFTPPAGADVVRP